MPRFWAYGHIDFKYIQSIHKKFGKKKLNSYPHLSVLKLIWFTFFKKIKIISILNYLDYNKSDSMKVLQNELNWKNYGGKHYESVYTKFYQGILLPQKFNIDKRKIHLSALILAGQITRETAQNELKLPIYPIESYIDDQEYVLKKLSLSKDEWNIILNTSNKTFLDYPNHYYFHLNLKKIINYFRIKKLLYS